jgi:hypothetical protein
MKNLIVLLLLACISAFAAAPRGWFLAGSQPKSYETGVDNTTLHLGNPSAFLKSTATEPIKGFGTLMQSISAENYRAKRIRLTASVKSTDVKDWSGVWMRVDKGSSAVAFDNMQNRPIKGTTDWKEYTVVLDVPNDATGISFGILLSDTGAVWLSGIRLEAVDSQVVITSITTTPKEPRNLNFLEP